jgi:hypothetical protein
MRKIIAIAVLSGFTLACGGVGDAIGDKVGEEIAEKALEGSSGSDVELGRDGSMTVTGADGSMSTLGSATLPSDWPSDVPTVKNGTLTLAGSTPGAVAGKNDFTVAWTTTDGKQAVIGTFAALESAGWTRSVDLDMGDGALMTWESGDKKRNVSIVVSASSTETGKMDVVATVVNLP